MPAKATTTIIRTASGKPRRLAKRLGFPEAVLMIVVVAFAGIDFRLFERELEIPSAARLLPENYSSGCRFLDWQRVLN